MAATCTTVPAGQAVGTSLTVSGTAIPLAGFAVTTVIFAAFGLHIAAGLRRYAGSPRTTWIRTTVALTALCLLPDVLADTDTSTKALLMVPHLVAASIVIPTVARRLRA